MLLLLGACSKEKDLPVPAPAPETKTIHYSLTVKDIDTRSTLGDDFKHLFEAGDRIYVESTGGEMYGFLSMPQADGVGESTAVFEGDLTSAVDFTPVAETPINLTLVGPADDLHTFVNGKLTGVNYTDKSASSLKEAVRKYAHFTGSGNFGDLSYSLTQSSSFLVCALSFDAENTPVGTSITAKIINNASSLSQQEVHSHTAVAAEVDGDVEVAWVIPFAPGLSFTNAKMTVMQEGKDDVNLKMGNQSLVANSYYTFQRTTYLRNYFTVEATQANTQITFNYAEATDGVQYSRDGFEWFNYKTTDGSISLSSVGDYVYFRSKRASYQNSGSTNKPLITVAGNKACYVYGDLMFLSCDAKFRPKTTMPDFAFQGLFKECAWLRIDENANRRKPLTLSATTLSKGCYAEMFVKCTGLSSSALSGIKLPSASTVLAPRCFDSMFRECSTITTIPEGFLPYTQLAFACYRKMFEGCTSLVNVPSGLLPALTLAKACYIRMFWGCSQLEVAPDLMATTPAPACYFQLFRNCSKIRYVKCLMLLTSDQRIVYTNPNKQTYDDSADPPADNLEIWEMISAWSVFNKWLVNTNNSPLNNGTNTTAQFVKHPEMTYWRVNNPSGYSSVNWMGVVPSNWGMTNYPGVINW